MAIEPGYTGGAVFMRVGGNTAAKLIILLLDPADQLFGITF